MKFTKKEHCKNLVKEIIKDVDHHREEALLEGVEIKSIPDLPLFNSANSFAKYLQETYEYTFATARNAIRELKQDGKIYIAEDGYYSLSDSKPGKNISKNISSQLYATVLPVKDVSYIEVPHNMAFTLANELNTFLNRNNKRFYAIADNLLIMLDLKIPTGSNIVEKKFNLFSFLRQHGIPTKDYNLIPKPIRGYDETTFLGMQAEADYEAHLNEPPSEYGGKLNSPRRLTPRTTLDND